MHRLSFILILTAPLLNACTSLSFVSGGSDFRVGKNIVFTPEQWPVSLVADVYQPDSAEATPAVLLIHGGGWSYKERRGDMVGIAKKLAKSGYFVMNTTYRLTPEWQFPAQKNDVDLALRYLRENARVFNIDPERIATFGYSAGGHLAALAGFDPENNVKAIVAGGTPSDLSLWPDGKLTGLLLGGPVKGNEEIYREASPVTHVRPNSPPVFIYHGTDDTLVPIEHPNAFIAALGKNDVKHESYWIEGRGHILTHLFSAGAIPRAIDFLDHYLGKPSAQ